MPPKPRTAAGYEPAQVAHVRATCLYVATKLGDVVDELVIVGGLVPSLIIDQAAAPLKHVGTADLDIGLALAVFDGKRYQLLTERLRQAGFGPDTNERGNPTRQRWVVDGPPRVAVDFLVAPTDASDRGGRIKNIEADFAAIIAPGLRLAFEDRVRVTLDERTIRGERARREVWVCGPGAFVAMKALAFHSRGENKDAYDLAYVLQNYEGRAEAVAKRLAPLRAAEETAQALEELDRDFASVDSLGPVRVSEFLHGGGTMSPKPTHGEPFGTSSTSCRHRSMRNDAVGNHRPRPALGEAQLRADVLVGIGPDEKSTFGVARDCDRLAARGLKSGCGAQHGNLTATHAG